MFHIDSALGVRRASGLIYWWTRFSLVNLGVKYSLLTDTKITFFCVFADKSIDTIFIARYINDRCQ